jgi:RNA polymerase sigma-70 factor (ECF subfamily)
MSSALASNRPFPAADEEPIDFATVYRCHAQSVARWAARLGGPDIDVEDLVQDIFLNVQRSLPQFRNQASIATWLYRITQNAVTRRRRKLSWRRWLSGSAEDVAGGVAGPGATPLEALESRQAQALVYRALDSMKERHRTLLILFELEEMPGEQIAELTGTRTATVWVQLHRARAEFLSKLSELQEGER